MRFSAAVVIEQADGSEREITLENGSTNGPEGDLVAFDSNDTNSLEVEKIKAFCMAAAAAIRKSGTFMVRDSPAEQKLEQALGHLEMASVLAVKALYSTCNRSRFVETEELD